MKAWEPLVYAFKHAYIYIHLIAVGIDDFEHCLKHEIEAQLVIT